MIDLKSVVEKYPECLESATKFKSYMMDLYPENADRARIKVLTDVINCGIVDEIKDGKTDSISIANYRDKMENAFGYSGRLVLEGIMQWIRAYETNQIHAHNRVVLRMTSMDKPCFADYEDSDYFLTSVGKLILNNI